MNEKKFIDDNFFIIDSDSLNEIKGRLYGYIFCPNTVLSNCEWPQDEEFNNDYPGIYTFITADEEQVSIKQDRLCSQQLFLYRETGLKDGSFCISNSFWKLCEYVVKKKRPLSFNRLFAQHYLSIETFASLDLGNTLSNEICTIPQFTEIYINKTTKILRIVEADVAFDSVPLDSRKGMEIVDSWISKWGSLLKAVWLNNWLLQIDLSGGYDTRTALSLACAAGIDFNTKNVQIYSFKPETEGVRRHCAGDYEIAQSIASLLGTEINQNLLKTLPMSGKFSYEIFRHSFLGFHREGRFSNEVFNAKDPILGAFDAPVFQLGGHIGEAVRKVYPLSFWWGRLGKKWKTGIDDYKNLWDAFTVKKGKSHSEAEALRRFFLDARRVHYGAFQVWDFLLGRYDISPFSDVSLLNLAVPDGMEQDVIFALILARACPRLLEIPFAGNSDFSTPVKEFAFSLCKKYPANIRIEPYNLTCSCLKKRNESFQSFCETSGHSDTGEDYLYRLFCDESNKKRFYAEFGGRYGKSFYEEADALFQRKQEFFYNKMVVPVVAVMNILALCEKAGNQESEALEYLNTIKQQQQKNLTARIDIKNYGATENNVTLISHNDTAARFQTPDWITNSQGSGLVIHSVKGFLRMEIKCIGNGDLKIFLRGRVYQDKEGKRFPEWVDYTYLEVDGKCIFDKSRLVWHDRPFSYSMQVMDGQVVRIHVEWREAYDSLEREQEINLKTINQLKKSKLKTEKSITKLNNELKNIKVGWSFRIGRIITYIPRKVKYWLKK